ncbi:MAG: DMT family transporter [Anaerolineales bacterium]|nr:DMT family transporter [Anaerolineales bacterium]MDW8227986.1 DMT family transporter [Anaerolineales bacterium]
MNLAGQRQKLRHKLQTGIGAALASALFLGMTPTFGKQAINLGVHPFWVVALRTLLAALVVFLWIVLFRRSFLYIYPAGLLGCGLAGAINGLGSVFYYLSLQHLDVSLGQLLYSLYPVFLVLWSLFDKQKLPRLTFLRLLLALVGVFLLTSVRSTPVNWLGVFFMLTAAALYALHLPINQRILYDIPAPTVTMYTLIAMSLTTFPFAFFASLHALSSTTAWLPILSLGIVTALSRLTLFLGVKHIGGLQTVLLSIGELLVSIFVSRLWLGERLTLQQWWGALFIIASIALIGFEKIRAERLRPESNLLRWLNPPQL